MGELCGELLLDKAVKGKVMLHKIPKFYIQAGSVFLIFPFASDSTVTWPWHCYVPVVI